MRIQHNISALNTHRNLAFNNASASKNLEKLSSGYKINRAGDDAAGLSISEKMRGQIRGLEMASKNSQDGISLIQTTEGALNEVHSILQRMRELTVQAANDTNVTEDRKAISDEIDQLNQEIVRIKDTTEFNTKKVLNGTADKVTFQVGANKDQKMEFDFKTAGIDLTTVADGTKAATLKVDTFADATNSIDLIDKELAKVSAGRSLLGAAQNRLEHTINNLGASAENLTASESRIRDTDMAKEMMGFTKNNILMQAAQSMLAQANQQPQGVLQLLQ
ncbi:flagellin Hag [Lysinibacillus sp. JNUCC 51]|uniref:flagellin Hag n=1 Tax=Lysinibacillus sp. JNUCC-51 TaxID=2792479 RepID=UPI001936341D|nr:flagellin Hag [Lysinibacillus sp. JNUCC-51]